MKVYAVITGDINHFTKLSSERRNTLILETEALMRTMVSSSKDAQVFRGDSYQLIIQDVRQALKRGLQLICWFKLNADPNNRFHLGARMSIGIGEIAYEGKSVLDSDGEAFHLSGRNFDNLSKDEIIRLTTANQEKNECYEMLFIFINTIMKSWTPSQAATIFQLLDKEHTTQEQVAQKLKMTQPAIAYSLRAARWKEVEKGINYISKKLEKQYLI